MKKKEKNVAFSYKQNQEKEENQEKSKIERKKNEKLKKKNPFHRI